jgi:hypothetical protein
MLDTIRKYFNIKIILSAVLLALVAFAIFIALMIGSKPKQRIPVNVTAIVNVVPAPTWTQAFPTPTQALTATGAPGDSQTPGVIAVGAFVEVIGTGGSGLRLRVEPDLEAEVRLLGGENEIFEVKDGPREAGGYIWWYLVGPYDESRRGWAVADFLSVTQNP